MVVNMTQEKRKALGRGLETLLPRKPSAISSQHSAQTAATLVDDSGKQNQDPSASPSSAGADSGFARDDKKIGSSVHRPIGPSEGAAGSGLGRSDKSFIEREIGAIQAGVAAAAAAIPVAKVEGAELRELALDEIERNPFQTRARIKEDAIEELAASIRANGVMQPIVVRVRDGKFQLIAGERRWLASKKAGKTKIPALVKQVSDQQALELTIIENIQREDLGPLEQARAFERLSREFGMTQEMMANRTGKDRATVANYLRLLKLPGEVQMELEHNFKITLSHAKLLLMLDREEDILRVAKEIVSKNLSVLQTEEVVFDIRTPLERQPAQTRYVDPNVRQAERQLEAALGCRVRIKDRSGRGKITIEYANLTDFDRVVEKLT